MNLTSELNEEQRKAVEQIEGPCMIVAGAGSGKTRVLTYKIAFLIESGINPFEMLALTFTNKAANEMKHRIHKLAGAAAENLWMGTFHSVFAKILRIEAQHIGFDRNFTIYDDDDSEKVVEACMKELGFSTDNPKPKTVNSYIKGLKNKLVLPDDIGTVTNPFEKIAVPVYREYQNRLIKNNAMDFDDLLINPIILFRSNPDVLAKYQNRFKFILVDEYQDTNRAQYEIVKMLAQGYGNISVVGDDAQSIYRWRGAEIENILKFESDFEKCNVFKLEQNYRSTKNILSLADEVIKNNKRQIKKTLFTDNHDGDKVTLAEVFSDRDEGMMVVKWILHEIQHRKLNFKDFVILYRTNAQSRVIEDALRTNSIPYIIVGGVKFYQRKEIKDVLAYLKVLVNPKDDEAMTRILKLRDGIGEQTVEKLKAMAKEIAKSIAEVLLAMLEDKNAEGDKAKRRTKIENELIRVAEIIKKYNEVKEGLSPSELARSIVDEIGILRELRNDGTDESMDRMYNVQELLSGISEYTDNTEGATLEGFLQEVSLVTDIDKYDTDKNAVTLMTTHSSKGLEFPVVFITGLEDGIFPLSSSMMEQEEMEEERRLFYVAITRAMKKLYMTYALQRYRFGNVSYQMKSRFINEIDTAKLDYQKSSVMTRHKSRAHQDEGSSIKYEFYNNKSGDDVLNDIFREDLGVKKGSVVFHNNFGKGKVIDVTGRGDAKKASIHFEKVGVKNIILKYANLTIK
ncbi:MAG TPA: UvrD-helicase domain-containing protein [Ignavibacteria bacterium]|nr:UvrD-helicase domain-containing protein [Ignavibacteria bacterium]HRF64600.1 UvrD-helicase domain-containing protein [Ignavibacteria bacterium]HRJ05017.1 UvrD-helicase domain-containing protein [Ignavibacteria bacterium]HRJ85291.1 UvrD-helicase domain-containing protein [Ignavibacteria bacterium]